MSALQAQSQGQAPPSMTTDGASLAEPRSIVQSLISKFQAATDITVIQEIDAAYEELQRARAQKLSASRDTLHQWMKKVEGAKWEAQRPADKSETVQTERMVQLEKERMALAKTVNDLELVLQQEESTYNQLLDRLTKVRRRMEALNAERSSINDHKIRAAVYRDLGLSWVMDDLGGLSTLEEWRDRALKCRIVAHRSNDIFTLSFAPAATSLSNAFEDANQAWKMLSK